MSDDFVLDKKAFEAQRKQQPFLNNTELFYQFLKDEILSSKILSGTKINVSSISTTLNLSATPVRNAVMQLADDGLLVHDPAAKSYRVFNISNQMFEDIFDARKVLEGNAAFICAQNHALLDLKSLRYMSMEFQELWLKSISSPLTDDIRRKRVNIDKEFHNFIMHAAGNPFLIDYYKQLEKVQVYSLLRASDFWDKDNDPKSKRILAGQHMTIFNAISMGFADIARNAAEDHMEFCKQRALAFRRSVESKENIN